MIIGIGLDIVGVDRFTQTVSRTPRAMNRVLTERERELPVASQAARFAAKEAFAKALGAPEDLNWLDVEVVTDDAGSPKITISGTAHALCDHLGVQNIHLSLSHDAGIASAMVVLEGE